MCMAAAEGPAGWVHTSKGVRLKRSRASSRAPDLMSHSHTAKEPSLAAKCLQPYV